VIGFAVPWVIGGAVFGAVAVTALHFLSVRRPPMLLLPTARFLANRDARAVSRSTHPSDVLLLLLRVLAVLLAGMAFAGPRWTSGSSRVIRLTVADRSWMHDSNALLARVNDNRETNTTTARDHRIVWSDTALVDGTVTGMRAQFAAAFPLAIRAATEILPTLRDADSIALNIVEPPGGSANSEAWNAWRSAWPGAIRVYSAASLSTAAVPTSDSGARVVVQVVSHDADDVVAAAYAAYGVAGNGVRAVSAVRTQRVRTVRVFRHASDSTRDSTRGSSEVTVFWPTDGIPEHWRASTDIVGAIAARDVALVAPFVRHARVTAEIMRNARAIAWWSDGEIAAVEQLVSGGCVRNIGIAVPASGDQLLGESARGLLDALIAPCGVQRRPIPIALLSADTAHHTHLAVAASLRLDAAHATSSQPAWLTPVLTALALLLLVAEWVLRDRRQTQGAVRGVSA